MDKMMRNSRRSLQCNGMCDLQQVDFALYELNLYLDAYPDCKEAMALFQKYKQLRSAILAEYEKTQGPITAMGNMSDTWNWVKTPWPWEG
jgi:spore coat protein JB